MTRNSWQCSFNKLIDLRDSQGLIYALAVRFLVAFAVPLLIQFIPGFEISQECSLKLKKVMLANTEAQVLSRPTWPLSWIVWQLRVPRNIQRGNTCRAKVRYRETRITFAKTIFKVQGCKGKCCICVRLIIEHVSNYLYIWPELVTS